MELNVEYFREVLIKKDITNREFARMAGICHTSVTKILNKNMKAGMKTCKAIRGALQDEPVNKLFI
ncbi:MAG: hypothetical protein ACRCYC_00805 [Paraclostridium sp.]|uniref:hypothetical protein n=1 Tax=Paraclostridium sp. TaxID=2023273 RepID=UPI003F3358AD